MIPMCGRTAPKPAQIMQKLGYGPDKRLTVKVSARNIAIYRDPAVILIDQLKEIYIDGELEPVETANWFPKLMRKDYQIGSTIPAAASTIRTSNSTRITAAARSATTPAIATRSSKSMFDQQSMEADPEKRRKLVWEIDKKLQEDVARPIIYHFRAATCWQPEVKGLTIMVNSQYNGWRFEDVWLDE